MIGTLTMTILLLTSLAGTEENALEQGTLAEKITETSSPEQEVSRASYLIKGCCLGSAYGVITGMFAGCIILTSRDEEYNDLACIGRAVMGAMIGGVLGGIIGLGTGRYIFEKQEKKLKPEDKNPLEGGSSIRFQVIPLQRNSYQGFVVVAQYSF
mgnify:CR=1 FL=1